MQLEIVKDKERLAAFLSRSAYLHYYHLGDLDDFYWPNTTWYCAVEGGEIQALALKYENFDGPIILGILDDNEAEMRWLLEQVREKLPDQIYAHLSPGLEGIFHQSFDLEDHGPHYKMVLRVKELVETLDTENARQVLPKHENVVLALFEKAYPGNWFNPAMLETGMYFGWWDDEANLRSIAGVHVYAPEFGVAAIGNVTTDPDFRSRGLGTLVTGKLCQELLQAGITTVGLNVRQDNPAAVRSYQKLGFEVVGEYSEMMMTRR